MNRRRWISRGSAVAALLVLAAVVRSTVCAPAPISVRATRVERGRVEETVTNSRAGTVKARRRAKLSPEVGGRVVELPFKKGDRVRAGQVVLRLDDSIQVAQAVLAEREREAAAAQREQACFAAERAGRESARAGRLAAQGIVSADLLDATQSQAQSADAACTAARAAAERAVAAVALARVTVEKMVLRAPFDGIVADLMIELGEWTMPAPPAIPIPPVVDLIDTGSICVSAPMDEVDSARVKVGQVARASVDSYPGRHFPARVVFVAPYVLDRLEQNRTVDIEVELQIADPIGSLLPGTSADVEVVLSARDGVLRVPTPVVFEDKKVLLVRAGRLVDREVEVGIKNWDYTEIRAGLSEGDEVVATLDRAEIKAGARVRVEPGVNRP